MLRRASCDPPTARRPVLAIPRPGPPAATNGMDPSCAGCSVGRESSDSSQQTRITRRERGISREDSIDSRGCNRAFAASGAPPCTAEPGSGDRTAGWVRQTVTRLTATIGLRF